MGLFDFLFHRNNRAQAERPLAMQPSPTLPVETQYVPSGGVAPQVVAKSALRIRTSRVEIGSGNYDKICSSFIAFDTETTGLSPYSDVIIEVGAVKFVNGAPVASYSALINEGKPVSEAAFRVNMISTEMLRRDGKAPQQAYRELTSFFGDAMTGDTIVCAHNAEFDMSFLEQALKRQGYSAEIRYIDTLALSRGVVSGVENYRQGTLAGYFGIANACAHRAVSDAEVCGKILCRLLELEKPKIDREKAENLQYRLADEDVELFSVLAHAMRDGGVDIRRLRVYRDKHGYVSVEDGTTIFRFKAGARKPYVLLPKKMIGDIANVAPCSKAEDPSFYARLVVDDPLDFLAYQNLFVARYHEIQEALKDYIYDRRHEFQETGYLYKIPDSTLDDAFSQVTMHHQERQLQLRELAREKEQQAVAQKTVRLARVKKRQEADEKKQQKNSERSKLLEEMDSLLNDPQEYSAGRIARIAEISAALARHAVVQLTDEGTVVKVFGSVADASEAVGVSTKSIRDVANGKGKHAGGFRWKFAEDYTQSEEV